MCTLYIESQKMVAKAMGDSIFPLKPSFKLGFKPNFGLKPN